MKRVFDKKNSKKKKKVSSGGFTLVELLATIAVLSLIVTIVIYTATNVINSAKESSYKVTVSNIEKEAGTYVVEDNNSISWINSDTNDYQYQCVTVQNLIDKGFFKGDVLESYIETDRKVLAEDYIYLERNKDNKTVTKTILLYGQYEDELRNGLCGNIYASGNISFEIEPDSGWSRSKKVTIYYNLYNNLDKVSSYIYDYLFSEDEDIKKNNNFNNRSAVETVTIEENGTLYASINHSDPESGFSGISSSLEITGIDGIKPKIDEDYNGDEVVRNSVVIPINVTDNESGVDGDSFSEEDIKVTIGGEEVTDIELEKKDDNSYELTIKDNTKEGEVVIIIDEDQVLDKVGNGNEETTLNPEVSFSNKYTISYDGNGGTVSIASKEVTYNRVVGELPTATRTGYTFNGWNTKADGSGDTYLSSTVYEESDDITLYAQWKANTYSISYTYNNGTKGSNAPGSGTYDSVLTIDVPSKTVTVTGNANGTGATVGSATSGGQTFAGWTSSTSGGLNTSTAMIGTTTNPSTVWDGSSTTNKYFKNLRTESGTVTLTAKWTPVAFKLPTVTKTGHTCGWNASSSGTTITYASGANYTPNENSSSSITMYAVCIPKTVTVTFMRNYSSTDTTSKTQTFTYGVSGQKFNSGYTRTGYTALGWATSQSATAKEWNFTSSVSDSWINSKSPSITLYAVWEPNSYVKIYYNAVGGTVTSSTTTDGGTKYSWTTTDDIVYRDGLKLATSIRYGETISSDGLANYNNSKYLKITKKGFVAVAGEEWICLNGCTEVGRTFNQNTSTYTSSDFCDASGGDCEVVLGVNWQPADGCYWVKPSSGVNCRLTMSTATDDNIYGYSGLYAKTSYSLVYAGMSEGYGWFAYSGFPKTCYARGDNLQYVGNTCSSGTTSTTVETPIDDTGCSSWKSTISGRCKCYGSSSWLGDFSTSCSAKGLTSTSACYNWCRNYATGAEMTSSSCQVTWTCAD